MSPFLGFIPINDRRHDTAVGYFARQAMRVTRSITIDEGELEFSFVRAPGPGGQKVNKTATAAQLRFDAAGSPSLPQEVRQRLLKLAGSKATQEGEIVIEAKRYRSQQRNRDDARERLKRLIQRATKRPKRRRRTRPTATSREKRLRQKRRRGEIKRLRRPPPTEE